MRKVIDGKVYSTETAEVIATNDFSDGTNKYNCGRTSSLYRTKKGNYFIVNETCWQGEQDSLRPLSVAEAIGEYENMYEECGDFEDAFPGVKIEEA